MSKKKELSNSEFVEALRMALGLQPLKKKKKLDASTYWMGSLQLGATNRDGMVSNKRE